MYACTVDDADGVELLPAGEQLARDFLPACRAPTSVFDQSRTPFLSNEAHPKVEHVLDSINACNCLPPAACCLLCPPQRDHAPCRRSSCPSAGVRSFPRHWRTCVITRPRRIRAPAFARTLDTPFDLLTSTPGAWSTFPACVHARVHLHRCTRLVLRVSSLKCALRAVCFVVWQWRWTSWPTVVHLQNSYVTSGQNGSAERRDRLHVHHHR